MPNDRAPATETGSLGQRPDTLLDRALELGSLSPSTQQLLELSRSDEADLAAITDALAGSPSLAAAVLRAANSPAYGQSREIGDLTRAVMVIGMQELHDVVAGTAMLSAFTRPNPLSQQFQSTAGLSAALARLLATRLGSGAGSTAYLGGLMCELGALACLAVDPSYAGLYRASAAKLDQRQAAELARYGVTTPTLASRILAASALPTDVSEAVGASGLEPEGTISSLSRVVAFSRAAALVLLSAVEHDDPARLREELAELTQTLHVPEIEPEELTRMGLDAATTAGLPLRGKLALLQGAPPFARHTTATVFARQRSRVPLYLLALAVVAALAWLLTR
jgi:HD-like signal output (HDOD) protein